ncbi:MAG: methyltransferase domain-containing protein [Granulicella sp.]
MVKVDLARRANPEDLPEMMDQPCTCEELNACLRDIARVNRLTGAYRPTFEWFAELVKRQEKDTEQLQIVDVGCGYGDSLRRLHGWAVRQGIALSLTGIDLNGDAIRAATAATPKGMNIRWVHGDAFSYAGEVDVVLSSLLTHHLAEAEIVRFLAWMEARARRGWFVNDLHRKAFPYYAFRVISRLLPFHAFVRHDGPVSIRRSFLVEDWQRMCAEARLPVGKFSIREYRPARLCVGRIKR